MDSLFLFVNDALDIPDEAFVNPSRNVILPPLPSEIKNKLGIDSKAVLIKKGVFEKNKRHHKELSPNDSRMVLNAALTNADLIINDKPSNKPNYWIIVNLNKDVNAIINVDIDPKKQYVEVVGWRKVRDRSVEQIKNRAIREGGQVLMTQKGAAGLSALTDNAVSVCKDNTK